MFSVGENVVYGWHGVCTVLDLESRTVDGRVVKYIVLQPLAQPGSRFYVPAHNPTAVSKIRRLITREELDELLNSPKVRQNCWIEDENERKIRYRELITSGDREAILQMVHTIYDRRNELNLIGRRLHLCDDNFLQDAKKLLDAEIACVLGIEPGEVSGYINAVFGQNTI